MRKDVFDNMVVAEGACADKLSTEGKRYIERLIKLGQRDGKVLIWISYGHTLTNIY